LNKKWRSILLKVISRPSRLAKIQVREIMDQLPSVPYRLRTVKSTGDIDKRKPLSSGVPADFFSKELDQAVLNGKADVAIHSAKDLSVWRSSR
jgi:porphobilinogen deaminase